MRMMLSMYVLATSIAKSGVGLTFQLMELSLAVELRLWPRLYEFLK